MDTWKDTKRTLKRAIKNHKKVIQEIEENQKLFKGHFENEYGERYVIKSFFDGHDFPIFKIAGDETSWEWLQLLKVGGHIVVADNFFGLNPEEYKKAKKLVK